ncbi:pentapeptide repeat-containing protein [Leucobacter viscericola]|uniref:Pentapeptide repeat-containing protein n=1 Tax=Leucobacter viscericola TaxID=2714935 RepID=A0A6G7XBZ3_9MICO|nr:pentapeptide repeat-containing protein [Leucobacter viscericola]QIK61986.1 pentapeptide repeat-containing protein [Leucobacter viscericola]
MARSRKTDFPTLSPLFLPELEAGDPELLTIRGSYELTRFADADVSERDLSGVTFSECELIGLSANNSSLRGARLLETRVEQLNAPVFPAPRVQLREVEITHSRLGAAEMYDAVLQQALFAHCKLGWVNLRASDLSNVVFRDCVISELDLVDARLKRVSFENCRADVIHLSGAKLEHVDLRGLEIGTLSDAASLRGATLSSSQAASLTRVFAEHLGILVED